MMTFLPFMMYKPFLSPLAGVVSVPTFIPRLLKMLWRLLSSVVMLLILVSGISEREQRSALRISPVLVSRSSP